MQMNIRWMVVVVALAASACGGDDAGGVSNDATVLEVQDVLQRDQDFPMSDEQANCAAQNIVDNVDADTLDTMLESPEADLDEVADPDTALQVLDGIFDCVDIQELMVTSMVEDGTPQDVAECLAEGFGEDELRSFMISASAGEDAIGEEAAAELFAKLFSLAADCGFTG